MKRKQSKEFGNLIEKEFANHEEIESKAEKEAVEKKATNTAFILMFPALILAIIAVYYTPLLLGLLAILLVIYQFLMLKKFIEEYYTNR